MQFGLVSVISLLAAISPALATTPLEAQLRQLTIASMDTEELLKNTNPATIFQNVPRAISTWRSAVVGAKQQDVEHFPQSVEKNDQPVVCQEFVSYTTKSQDFMNALLGKHGLLAATPFTRPITAILKVDQEVTQTLSANIAGVVPECKDMIADPSKKLEEAYKKAVELYN